MATTAPATVTSADGTRLAVDVLGAGPPLIMAAGAFCTRAATAPLAEALQDRFTVYNYDRRGRGDSGDTAPYSVDREIEDIAALVSEAGGSAALFGHSSGGTLALRAAAAGVSVNALVVYEAPFLVDGSRAPLAADLPARLMALVADGHRGEAVELYQTEGIGIPAAVVEQMRDAPFRPALEAIAHTLAYDALVVGDLTLPVALLESISVPVLSITGDQSPPMLQTAAAAVVAAVPRGELRVLAGESHDVRPAVTAPVVAAFLAR